MLGRLFGGSKKEIKTKTLDLGQVEVIIQLYSGQIIKKNIKGVHDEIMDGYYSPAKHQLQYFMERVRKENVLEIMRGHYVNVAQEIKSVTHGEILPYKIEIKED